MSQSSINYAKKQIRILNKEERKNRKFFAILSACLSAVNILVVVLASVALKILLSHSDINTPKIRIQIIMASVAASITIIIFILNMFLTIYRGLTRADQYKRAYKEIQKEYIAFSLREGEYKGLKTTVKLEENVKEIYNKATKRNKKKKISKMVIRALSGGDNV